MLVDENWNQIEPWGDVKSYHKLLTWCGNPEHPPLERRGDAIVMRNKCRKCRKFEIELHPTAAQIREGLAECDLVLVDDDGREKEVSEGLLGAKTPLNCWCGDPRHVPEKKALNDILRQRSSCTQCLAEKQTRILTANEIEVGLAVCGLSLVNEEGATVEPGEGTKGTDKLLCWCGDPEHPSDEKIAYRVAVGISGCVLCQRVVRSRFFTGAEVEDALAACGLFLVNDQIPDWEIYPECISVDDVTTRFYNNSQLPTWCGVEGHDARLRQLASMLQGAQWGCRVCKADGLLDGLKLEDLASMLEKRQRFSFIDAHGASTTQVADAVVNPTRLLAYRIATYGSLPFRTKLRVECDKHGLFETTPRGIAEGVYLCRECFLEMWRYQYAERPAEPPTESLNPSMTRGASALSPRT